MDATSSDNFIVRKQYTQINVLMALTAIILLKHYLMPMEKMVILYCEMWHSIRVIYYVVI